MSTSKLAQSSIMSWVTTLSLPIVAGVLLGMSVVYFLVPPIWGDQAIALYMAGRLLDGANVDVHNWVDANPPLILWISELPVELSRWTGISPQVALELYLAALLALVIPWSMRLARRVEHTGSYAFVWWFAVVLVYGTAVYPWQHYAQREHILIIMALPYLMMAVGRLEGVAPTPWEAVAAGLLASIGFSLKPYDLSIVIAVEALLAYRTRNLRNLIRPEILALVLGGFSYCVAVAIWTPEYYTKIVPLALSAYVDFGREPLWKMIDPPRGLKIVGLVVLWAIVRRRLRHEPLVSLLFVAAIGGVVAYFAQRKGFEYHFLPAKVLFTAVIGLILIDFLLPWVESRQRPIPAPFRLAAALLTSVATAILFFPVQSTRAATEWDNEAHVRALRAITAELPRGTTISEIGPGTGVLWDLLLDRRLVWGSRFPDMWTLATIFQAEFSHDKMDSRAGDRATSLAQWTREAVAEDLQRWHPSVVLVERCDDASIGPCFSLASFKVNILQWFQRDPAFASAWSKYAFHRAIGPYDLWCAKEDGDIICQHVLSMLPTEE